ncbi:MAG: thioredoxin [Oscillospiraceae bacterium]
MEILTLNKENFGNLVLDNDGTVLVDFWASWCGPCMMLSPIVDEIAAEKPELTVGKVNVDENQELAIRYGIDSIPALLLFRGGKLAGRSIGYLPKEQLIAKLGL